MTINFASAVVVERVGWLLVHSVWQFALIALLLAVVLRLMRRAPAGARYAAALAGWGLMLVAPAATWPLLSGPVPQADVVTTAPALVDSQPMPLPVDSGAPYQTPAEAFDVALPRTAADFVASSADAIAPPARWTETLAATIAPWLNTLVVLWCAGVFLFGARSTRSWIGVRRLLRRDVVSVPDEMTTLLVSVLKRVGLTHRVRLLQSPHVDVPLVVGWLRPVILLPVCVVTGFSPAQLEAVLAHELAHIRRHDYLINLLQTLSETVFFYHPALWWASAVVRREREHCCDELAARALGNRAEYGRALLALEELRGATPALALGAKGGSLLERIRRLAQLEPSPRFGAGGVVGIGLVAAVALMAAVWTTTARTDASTTDARDKRVLTPEEWRQHIVTIHAENVTVKTEGGVPHYIHGPTKYFSAIVMDSDSQTSYLLATSWGAKDFWLGQPPSLPANSMTIDGTDTVVKVVGYDINTGVAVLSAEAPLSPLPRSAIGDDVQVGDLLTELQCREMKISGEHPVLAADDVYRDTGSYGQPVDVPHMISLDRALEGSSGSLLLHEGRVVALFLDNAETIARPYAVPMTVAMTEYARLKAEAAETDRATSLARKAHAYAAAIDKLPKFYIHAKGGTRTFKVMENAGDEPLANLLRALDEPVVEAEWYRHEPVFGWDEQHFLAGHESPKAYGPDQPEAKDPAGNPRAINYRWGTRELGASRDEIVGRFAQCVFRKDAAAMWDHCLVGLNYYQATPHQFWWGDTSHLNQSFNLLPPVLAEYRSLEDAEFDGEACHVVESATRQERLWISKTSGLIRGYLNFSYHGPMTKFYESDVVTEIAGKKFASQHEYGSWYHSEYDKLPLEKRVRLQKAWSDTMDFSTATPTVLVRFRDYREIAPGLWWPFREDRAQGYKGEKGYECQRSESGVDEIRLDLDLAERVQGLMPKEGEQVQDQRYAVPIMYKYSSALTEAEILKLVDVEYQKQLEGEETLKRLAAPYDKLLGQPALTLPQTGWVGGKKPDIVGKPYLLHFWATWCGPCKNDLPILKSGAEDGAIIIGMHPSGTPAEDVQKAIDENELPYATFVETKEQPSGPGGTIAGYPADMFPYCVLVDADGRVVAHGGMMANNGEILAKFRDLRAAANAPAAGSPTAVATGDARRETASEVDAAVPAANDAGETAGSASSPIGPLTEVSVADQVARYAFDATIPADHYLWIHPTEVPERRGYSQAWIRMKKGDGTGNTRVELEFQYTGDERGSAANPLLSTVDEIQYGWSAPGCEPSGAVSIFGVPDFRRPTEDKKIVLVDPASEMAKAERGTRLLLIIPKDANPQTRAEVEAIQPRGEIVAFLEKIEPKPETPADQRLLGLWQAQRNAIGTSYIKYRRFRQGAGVLKALSPSQVAELFAPGGRRLAAEQAIAAASGLLVDSEAQLFGPEYAVTTFRSVGNRTFESVDDRGRGADARYFDGELDIAYDPANRQATVFAGNESLTARTGIEDFDLFVRLAGLEQLDAVQVIADGLTRAKAGPSELIVDPSGFVYSWQANLPEHKFASSTFQFEPQVPASGAILPRLRMDFEFHEDELESADIVLIDEARINEGFQPKDFALPLPAGTRVYDYRGGTERPRGREVKEAVDDAAAYVRGTLDQKVSSANGDGNSTRVVTANVKQDKANADDRVRLGIIQAKHVLLLDGKQIVTWQEIDEKIAAQFNPSRVYPELYVTRGAMEAGLEDAAQEEAFELHRKYKLGGHSVGSLTPRTDVHYDRIKTTADLVPDPALRVEGMVVDSEGNPVDKAEVVLVTPVDESISYKAYDIAIVEGRIRNPLDELLTTTDASGRFAVYPRKETPFSLLALQPDSGIALIDSEQFRTDPKLTLRKWGEVVVDLSTKPGQEPESTTLDTRLDETTTRPEISLAQYWSDLNREARRRGGDELAMRFEFTHVPAIWQTSIMRSFPAEEGMSHSIPGASISVLPGERRRITLGPVTEQQREFLKGLRDRLGPRAQAAPVEADVVAQPASGDVRRETAGGVDAAVAAEAEGKHDEWVAKLLRLKNHNQAAFAVGPLMIFELPADEALAVTREAWPQIKIDEVKTALLKTFEFDRHPQVLEVLDLGATDGSEKVRKYACSYLKNYAFRDFGGDQEQYAAWRKDTAGKPVLEVIQANAEWFVNDQKSKTPADDQLWWLEYKMMLDLGGRKSSYPEKGVYLRDAGFIELLQKWADDPQAGPHVKAGTAELITQIREAVGDAEHAAP